MGQKVNPYGLRLGIINDWRTRWYTEKDFAAYLKEDVQIRNHILGNLAHAGLSKIEIERTEQQVKIIIHAGRPGIVIGKKGAEVDKLRAHLEKLTAKRVKIDIQEVRRAEISAPLIAQNIAQQLEGRVSFRRAMKKAVSQAMAGGAKGVRIASAGRLGGAEMSRTEWYREGRVPLHTLKADIEYGTAEANTKSGKIGVKVWVYLGDVPLRGQSIRHEHQEEITEQHARPRPPRAIEPRFARKEEPSARVSLAEKMAAEKRNAAATKAAAPVLETQTAVAASEEQKAEAQKPVAEKKPAAVKTPTKKAAPTKGTAGVKDQTGAVAPMKETIEAKPAPKKPEAKKAPAEAKTPTKKVVGATKDQVEGKPAAKKPVVKKAVAKKEPVAKKAPTKKPAASKDKE